MQATQKLQLSQDQIQSLEILTMDTMQLQDFVQKEYLENPLLEYTPGRDSTFGPEDISRHYESDIPYRKTYEEAIEQDDMRRADIPSDEPEQFKRSLLHQLPPKELSSLRLHLYSYMIDCLDETGFLSIPLEEIAADTRTPLHEVERALGVLQHLEPRGLFAADLRQCLLIQLEANGRRNTDTWRVVDGYLEEIGEGRTSAVCRELGFSTARLRACIEEISRLDPRPRNALPHVTATQYLIPDILLKKEGRSWTAELNIHWFESYRLNDYYLHMMRQSEDEQLRAYFQQKLARITGIQSSIARRTQTILSITLTAAARQSAFLDGAGPLVPMTMADLAAELSMHPSTVSRAIKGKLVQCPQGTIPLRSMFTSAVTESENGDALNAEGINELIRGAILAEDREHPLSDQKITLLLQEKGVSISRRAVAQLREKLGFRSSYERKFAPCPK
ncbi:MAG: RNA polymerase factor sigma-54 [Firmicutes bacterium]|nr:RNA polymerase factor sigma-54 [Bacillota bacterium]